MSNSYRSDDIGLIFSALSKAQGAYTALIPNEAVAGGSFANLTAILEATRPALSANELSINFIEEILDNGNGASMIWCILGHSSGQWMRSCTRVIKEQTFRETYHAVESYKRLAACNILGIAPSSRDPLFADDNGIKEHEAQIVKNMRNPDQAVKSEFAITITQEQYDDLMFELEGYELIAKGVQDFFKIKTIADLPADQIHFARDKIRRLKKTHDEYVKGRG